MKLRALCLWLVAAGCSESAKGTMGSMTMRSSRPLDAQASDAQSSDARSPDAQGRDAQAASQTADSGSHGDAAASTAPECEVLPALPTTDRSQARLWFTRTGWFTHPPLVPPEGRIRVRNGLVYIAAGERPLRLDWSTRSLCTLEGAANPAVRVLDLLAPSGSSTVIVLFGAGEQPRTIRVSDDDGKTFRDAQQPALRSYESSVPSAMVSLPGDGARAPRMFATYGGPTLDVSDDGGKQWNRLIDGGDGGFVGAQGFAFDTAQQTLWYVAEFQESVGAHSLSLASAVATAQGLQWSSQFLGDWMANGVYAAEADPSDPHAIYLGGEGRLGYLRPLDTGVQVDTPWRVQTSGASEPYTYVQAIWPDPARGGRILFGGGQQGDQSQATLLESADHGSAPSPIAVEGSPLGVVRAIVPSPDESTLLVAVERLDALTGPRSLSLYVLAR